MLTNKSNVHHASYHVGRVANSNMQIFGRAEWWCGVGRAAGGVERRVAVGDVPFHFSPRYHGAFHTATGPNARCHLLGAY